MKGEGLQLEDVEVCLCININHFMKIFLLMFYILLNKSSKSLAYLMDPKSNPKNSLMIC